MSITEEQIPLMIREGKDKDVVPLLYKKVYPVLKKYIVSHNGSKEDAFDVFQDALVDFYNTVMEGTYNEKYKVFGLLFRSGINKWINKIRRDKKIDFKEEFGDLEELNSINDHEFVLLGKEENVLKNLFSPIGTKCVELLTCLIYTNMLMEDIMIRLNFPSVASVKMQQQRCKQKVIEQIEKNPFLLDRLKGI
ncbi:MAG: sigma-70 family RNA polymerase sigma factor [Opitutaceae bacterium]|nr:sigma-70 family RNA polymerase sigma factor [Cytophagales bacterium]